ncbi:hypothetical protein H4R34_001961 [Dimargaris verticillata]|uniref:B box-type domain-containing protein n=1 Tax=Dimargaris verticillata TaxID=2761393 RepID=A0A9W8BAC5_9FUNG|nr:hypothetical protein H4R34_001961 [Dimargaris verticillata]
MFAPTFDFNFGHESPPETTHSTSSSSVAARPGRVYSLGGIVDPSPGRGRSKSVSALKSGLRSWTVRQGITTLTTSTSAEGPSGVVEPSSNASTPRLARAVLSPVEELFQCFICMGTLRDAVICPKCSKLSCAQCITHKEECPHCRVPLTVAQLVNCRFVSELHERLRRLDIAGLSNSPKQHRISPIASTAIAQGLAQPCDERCENHDLPRTYFCLTCRTPLCSDCAMLSAEHKGHSFNKLDSVYQSSTVGIQQQLKELERIDETVTAGLQRLGQQSVQLLSADAKLEEELEALIHQEQEHLQSQVSREISSLHSRRDNLLALRQNIHSTQHSIGLLLDHHQKSELVLYKHILDDKVSDILAEVHANYTQTLAIASLKTRLIPEFEYDTVRIPHFDQILHSHIPSFSGLLFLASGIIWQLKITIERVHDQHFLSVALEMVKGRDANEPATYLGTIRLVHPNDDRQGITRKFSGCYRQGIAQGVDRVCSVMQLQTDGYYHSPDNALVIQYGVRAELHRQKDQDQARYIGMLEESLFKLKQQLAQSSPGSPTTSRASADMWTAHSPPQDKNSGTALAMAPPLPPPTFEFNFSQPASLGQVLAANRTPTGPTGGASTSPRATNANPTLTHGSPPLSPSSSPSWTSPLGRDVFAPSPRGLCQTLGDNISTDLAPAESDWSFLDNSPHVEFPPATNNEPLSFPNAFNDSPGNLDSGARFAHRLGDATLDDSVPLSRRATTGIIAEGAGPSLSPSSLLPVAEAPFPTLPNLNIRTAPRRSMGSGLGGCQHLNGQVPPLASPATINRRLSDVFARSKATPAAAEPGDFQQWLAERRRSGGRGAFSSAVFHRFHEAYDREQSTSRHSILGPSVDKMPKLAVTPFRKLVMRKSSPLPLNQNASPNRENSSSTISSSPTSSLSQASPPSSVTNLAASTVSPGIPSKLSKKAPSALLRPSPARKAIIRSAHRKVLRSPASSNQKVDFYTPILLRSLRRPGELEDLMRRQKEDPAFAAQLRHDHSAFFAQRVRRPLEGETSDEDHHGNSETLGASNASDVFTTGSTPEALRTQPAESARRYSAKPSTRGKPAATSHHRGLRRSTVMPPLIPLAKLKSPPSSKGRAAALLKIPVRSRATSLGRSAHELRERSTTLSSSLAATISPRGSRSVANGRPPLLPLPHSYPARKRPDGTIGNANTPSPCKPDPAGPNCTSVPKSLDTMQSSPTTVTSALSSPRPPVSVNADSSTA